MTRRRVHVLGGGVAGLTAAWHLSDTPAKRERFEVVVHQMGWRLGGKLASSRDRLNRHRNLEHGLHVWFGFYENAFGLMRRVYEAWTPPEGCPITTFDQAFLPHSYTPIGFRTRQGKPTPHDITWPTNEDRPGTGQVRLTPWGAVTQLVSLCERVMSAALDRSVEHSWRPSAAALAAMERLQRRSARLVDHPVDLLAWRGLLVALDKALEGRTRRLKPDTVDEHPVVALLDLVIALLRAMVDPDRGVVADWNLDAWNDRELRQLLKNHGGEPNIVDHWSGLRMIYDSTFQYRSGDYAQPDFAAGTGARVVLRTMTTYKGSVLYHLGAGAGETVISPLYEVLKQHGVRFRFFHDVERLHVHNGRVRAIHIRRQADDAGFEPTFEHGGLVCWPERSEVPGELERRWNRPEGIGEMTLREGQDFDDVVLAIPLGALRHRGICDELREHLPFSRMLDAPSLVPTTALQLWMKPNLAELGWTGARPALVGWTHPLSIWADMSHVLEHEEGDHASLHYLCGPLHTDLYSAEESPVERVRTLARLRIMKQLRSEPPWPSTERPDDHYLRVNIDPSECVVGSPAASVNMRLRAGESGYENLALAGAWTKNGIDASCVEAAVMSGMQAARHIAQDDLEVLGEGFMGPPIP